MEAFEEKGFKLFKQGAEGKLYLGVYLGNPAMVKERFLKTYRHPELDSSITKERMKAEARAMVRCKAAGIRTPTLYSVDFERRHIIMEHIESITVKDFIIQLSGKEEGNISDVYKAMLANLTKKMGSVLWTMHKNNIIHGDLTTSNMLLAPPVSHQSASDEAGDSEYDAAELVLIDFGLSHSDSGAESKGVDLYVLERALTSTHSVLPHLFGSILEVYRKRDCEGTKEVMEKYEEVRARGRKRTMVG